MNKDLEKAIKDFYRSGSVETLSSPRSLEVLLENNMIFPSEEIEHDELIEKLFHEKKSAAKESIVESFLVGLETGKPEKRAALSAYAIMLNFPKHSFQSTENIQCNICGLFKKKTRDFTFCNLARYSIGVSNSGNPEQLYFFLREHNKAPSEKVESIDILKKVLKTARESGPEETPVTLEKKVRAIQGSMLNKELSRGLLDLLGQIGVLESPDHKGFTKGYTYIGLAPKKSRSTDWSYPVDFWEGMYGVNEEAVEFWFGDYLKSFDNN
ncbi:hypothetical protein KBY08_17055 [Pseudomonas sp. P135]|uniref:hypothetical protein n=1 Tax=Pseudomonas sp. P135 TaxID=2730420 RepID=UPI001CE2C2E4|nr:hypothetical protein [Pseudomonas sp. P135]MCA5973418.1 hypothetical protein [Pseudomonas sp. P135]